MVSNCFASEQGRGKLKNPSALKFYLVNIRMLRKPKFLLTINSFFMLIVALYCLILNHNPATSVQANILFS